MFERVRLIANQAVLAVYFNSITGFLLCAWPENTAQ